MGLPLNSSTISVTNLQIFLQKFKLQDTALLGHGSLKLQICWAFSAFHNLATPGAQEPIQSPLNAVEIFLLLEITLLLSTAPGPRWLLLTPGQLRTHRTCRDQEGALMAAGSQ